MRDGKPSTGEGRRRSSQPQPPIPERGTLILILHIYKPCGHLFLRISGESATARHATASYHQVCRCQNSPGRQHHFELVGESEGENSAALAMVLVRDVGRARSLILRLLRERGESLLPALGKDTS